MPEHKNIDVPFHRQILCWVLSTGFVPKQLTLCLQLLVDLQSSQQITFKIIEFRSEDMPKESKFNLIFVPYCCK